jgi:hypothetical protein
MISTIVTASTNAAQLWFLVAAIIFIVSIIAGFATRTNEAYAWAGGLVLSLGLAAIALGLLFLA